MTNGVPYRFEEAPNRQPDTELFETSRFNEHGTILFIGTLHQADNPDLFAPEMAKNSPSETRTTRMAYRSTPASAEAIANRLELFRPVQELVDPPDANVAEATPYP